MKKKKIDKVKLVGRDPSYGRVSFKTGVILTEKDKLKKRNTKQARRQLRKEINEKEED